MNHHNNVISRNYPGNRNSASIFCDNSPIGDLILDALETFPPENGLDQLKRMRAELDRLIAAKEGPSKAWDAPNAPPRQGTGILTNPYRGRVDRVEKREIPAKSGGTTFVFKIHTGAAMFETYDRTAALAAYGAQQAGQEVQVRWKPRVKGRYTNYDIISLRVLDPHGRT